MASPTVCKVGMHWERRLSPRMFSPCALVEKIHHKEFRMNYPATSTTVLPESQAYQRSKTKAVENMTVAARTSKRANALCYKSMVLKLCEQKLSSKSMTDNTQKRRIFPTHIYDYNYKVSEGYYKPQKNYMDDSSIQRDRFSPPKHKTYAERFASDPWYGEARGLPYKTENSALNEPLIKLTDRPFRSNSLLRDMKTQEEDNIPLDIRANRRRKKYEMEDEKLGIRPRNFRQLSLTENGKPFGMLNGKSIDEKLRDLDFELEKLAPKRSDEGYFNSDFKSKSSKYSPLKSQLSSDIGTQVFKDEFRFSRPRPRSRGNSVSDISETIKHRHRHYSNKDEQEFEDEDDFFTKTPKHYVNKTEKIRNARKLKQSKEITDGIQNIVEKMRSNRINYEDGYLDKSKKDYRAMTLDPAVKEEQKIQSSYSYKHKNY